MSERLLGHTEPTITTARPVRTDRLQRKCACGKIARPEGECDECRKKRFQSKAQSSEVGHDFSKVRVHSDTRAAESARAMNALGNIAARDGVVEAGRFAHGAIPETPIPDTQPTPVENPQTPTPDTQPAPTEEPQAPSADTAPTPMKDTPTQGPAIAVTNGWANPGARRTAPRWVSAS